MELLGHNSVGRQINPYLDFNYEKWSINAQALAKDLEIEDYLATTWPDGQTSDWIDANNPWLVRKPPVLPTDTTDVNFTALLALWTAQTAIYDKTRAKAVMLKKDMIRTLPPLYQELVNNNDSPTDIWWQLTAEMDKMGPMLASTVENEYFKHRQRKTAMPAET
jgi:hypothetical protein